MTVWSSLRSVIMLAAVVVTVLWVVYGARSRRWGDTALALSYLIPLIGMFVLRLSIDNPLLINYISLGLYLEITLIMGAMALRLLRRVRHG